MALLSRILWVYFVDDFSKRLRIVEIFWVESKDRHFLMIALFDGVGGGLAHSFSTENEND